MTSRERVLTALAHRPPDRTPRDFWAEEPAWNRLLAYLGHHDRDQVLNDLAIDVRHLEIVAPPDRVLENGFHQNFWGSATRTGIRRGARSARTGAAHWPVQ